MSVEINTAKVTSFRKLRFETIPALESEIDRIVQAEASGKLKSVGNWTPGQILAHLASWIEYGYVGYPVKSPPWFVRVILKRMVRKYLRNGMPRGVRIPGTPKGTFGMDEMSTVEAADRLKQALARLEKGENCPHDSPAFGPMSHEDRILLNLRHAELHLGYLNY